MSQGFTKPIPIPLPINLGGTGSTSGTGTNLPVFQTTPTLNQPLIMGVTDGSNAAAGEVGELISSVILFSGSPVVITTATTADLTSISLTAGDWDVWGNVAAIFAGTGTVLISWTSTVSVTVPDRALRTSVVGISAAATTLGLNVPYLRYSLAATTTIYLSLQATFSSTAQAVGGIYARRVR